MIDHEKLSRSLDYNDHVRHGKSTRVGYNIPPTIRGMCAQCKRGVPTTEIVRSVPDDGYHVTASCHGATETIFVASHDPKLDPDPLYRDLTGFTFFRRNWAEYRRPTERELLEKLLGKR